jgi:hypothetical protein
LNLCIYIDPDFSDIFYAFFLKSELKVIQHFCLQMAGSVCIFIL